MPQLNPNPPEFQLKGRYTLERKEKMDESHNGDFLWPEERKLLHSVIADQMHGMTPRKELSRKNSSHL